MAPTLTPEDVVRRIAAECAFIDEHGGVGIRLEPAAAMCGHTVTNSSGRPPNASAPKTPTLL
jgi:hypothetical protein